MFASESAASLRQRASSQQWGAWVAHRGIIMGVNFVAVGFMRILKGNTSTTSHAMGTEDRIADGALRMGL